MAGPFSEIVVGVDLVSPCESALAVAGVMASRAGAAVRLVTIAAPGADHRAHEQELAELASLVARAPVTWELVESDEVVDTLTSLVEQGLLVLETHARGPLGAIFLGHTAHAVLHDAQQPALIVGPSVTPQDQLGPILVSVDGLGPDDRLLDTAGAWAQALGLDVHVVHARTGSMIRTAGAELARAAAREVTASHGVTATSSTVDAPTAGEAIVAEAERVGSGLLLVGMSRKPHAVRVALGSTSMAIARDASAPVVVVPAPPVATGSVARPRGPSALSRFIRLGRH